MRAAIRRLVDDVDPLDPLEAAHRADALTWIDSGADIFRLAKPATPPKHLVSYCVLVDRPGEQLLLVDHRDAMRWLPTGGHVDPGEHPVATARREIAEELGISPPFHPRIGARPLFVTVTETAGRSAGHTDVSLWFVFQCGPDAAIAPDEREFIRARWWSPDEILAAGTERFDPHLQRFVDKLRRRVADRV
ncbi:MAG: NUDIX domain-containing protein [Actinomycetota bacterium]